MNGNRQSNAAFSNAPLIALAGITWVAVGILLAATAITWLFHLPKVHHALFAGSGIAAGLMVHHLGFLRIVDKNLHRIRTMDRRYPLVSFIPWKSYLLIAFMMAAGFVLRHSALPKQYLSVIYLCMGLALMLSSIRYFRMFVGENKRKPA